MSFRIQPAAPARPNRCQLFGPGSRTALFEKMAVSAADVVGAIAGVSLALVLHEDASQHIADVELPAEGTGLLIVGPEGGIAGAELDRFVAAGAQLVSISDGVLRTSTAAAVALGQLDVLARRP